MSFHTETNNKRVEKIRETLALINKSANVNKTPGHEVHDLLKPVFHDLLVITGHVPEAGPEPVETKEEKKTYQAPVGSLKNKLDGLDKVQLCTLISLAALELEMKL